MATTLYLHSDLSAVGGTLPATEQSTTYDTTEYQISFPEPAPGVDLSGTHHLMDETQGASEDDAYFDARVNTIPLDRFQRDMVGQFVSTALSAGSIASGTWTIYLDADLAPGLVGVSTDLDAVVYLWRPSTGALITMIGDGIGVVSVLRTAGRAEYAITGTGAGATAQAGDVVVIEIWVSAQMVGASDDALYLYYDTGTDGRVVAPDLPFGGGGGPQTIPQVGVFDPHLNPQAWF